ncbi:LysR family transcriptional regulator [Photobacterium galatheae]|uniref:Transcriptional regulator n=1 Tax=Photobacterium galatheae TaxID=1654360 RepID=A0A066RQY5_9GAMM|nr:LysR family transcriptional regulator [Photobacterium galatheae]KDM92860.1 transcriptional regulator [Photobacterium galatheae]MCM0148175.1 LysR family transcriptional regulator [Photobacterium galatheae]
MSSNKHIGLMQDMAIFVSVVKTGSFSESARLLGVSPSAVSRTIKQLEQQLGVCLLQRTTRKLRLSETGRTVYERCLQLDEAAREVVSLCESQDSSARGVVKVAAPKAVAHSLIHPYVAEFLRLYPAIDVHLVLDDQALDLIEQEIDILFRITRQPPQGLIGRSLMPIDHVLCASPEYLARKGIPVHPKELTGHSCISLGENEADSKWRFRKGSNKITVPVTGRYRANHSRVRLEAAEQGIGIASLPVFVAEGAIAEGKIVQVLPEWEFETAYTGDLWMLYPATRHIPAKVSLFADYIVGKLGKS